MLPIGYRARVVARRWSTAVHGLVQRQRRRYPPGPGSGPRPVTRKGRVPDHHLGVIPFAALLGGVLVQLLTPPSAC